MEIDSLVISLGLDPSKLQAALEQVEAAVQQGQQTIIDFVQDIQDGFQEAAEEVAEGSAQGIETVGNASADMVNQFEEAVNRFSDGVDRLGQKSQQAAARARAAGGEVQALGRTIGRSIRGIISTVAAPLAGALSAGAIIGSYMGDVAQVAQMTGRYSTQMEEWRKKRELLSRINREDVELYRKGKLALLDFNFAMSGLSTTVMRALSPAIRFGIDLLTSLADWIRRNEPNIIRFFAVLAGTVTATLVPAFAKLGKAMLMNPLTWIIAGILLLAFAIDSLVTYIRGGESALDGLWSQFGTGEEILAWLTGAARSFLNVMQQYGPALAMVTGALTAVRVAMKLLGVAALSNPVLAILSAIAMAAVYIIANWNKISAFFQGVFDRVSSAFQKFVQKIKDMLPDWLKKVLGIDGASVEIPAQAQQGGAEQPQKAPTGMADPLGLGSGMYVPPTNAELTRAAVPPSATVNQTRTVNSETSIGQLNVYSQAQDADGILRDARGAADKRFYGFGALSAEGGVRP